MAISAHLDEREKKAFELLIRAGYRQQEQLRADLENKFGFKVSANTMSRLFRGVGKRPSFPLVLALSEALDVPMDTVVEVFYPQFQRRAKDRSSRSRKRLPFTPLGTVRKSHARVRKSA